METSPMKRYDSLSPKAELPSSPLGYPTKCQQRDAGPAVPELTFIVSNASDFDGKKKKPLRKGASGNCPSKKSSAISRDRKPVSSLAATHPAMYYDAAKICKNDKPATFLTVPRPVKKEKLRPVKREPEVKTPLLPWQTYVDSKWLTSQEPNFDHPRLRMLKIDVGSSYARTVSPVLMIGLPCGTLIEAAHVYQAQPRDPQSS